MSPMRLFCAMVGILLVSALFFGQAEASKKRILKKLLKGALVAKVLKPKLLPIPIPIPIPIIKSAHPIIWAEPEPWGHHGGDL